MVAPLSPVLKKSVEACKKGFTLIELLVVIAVMGVLATVVLVTVDPAEQFNRAEDSSRVQTVNTLGKAFEQYYVAKQIMPTPAAWMTNLVTAGELKQTPTTSGTVCTGNIMSGYCYGASGTNAVLYAALESKAEDSTCPTASDVRYFIYDSSTGKTCKVCGATTATFAPGACP